MPLQEQCRRFLCNPEQSEGEQALPLPGNKLERDPADKEIFKVQLMSEMTHWLNQTKVRLENKNPRCKEQGWWGCKRQRMRGQRGRGAKQWLWLGCDPRFAPDLSQAGYVGVETAAVDVQARGSYTCLLPPAGTQPFCSPNGPFPG